MDAAVSSVHAELGLLVHCNAMHMMCELDDQVPGERESKPGIWHETLEQVMLLV